MLLLQELQVEFLLLFLVELLKLLLRKQNINTRKQDTSIQGSLLTNERVRLHSKSHALFYLITSRLVCAVSVVLI